MNTRLLAAVVLAIGTPLWASGALAAQITFGPSAQSITIPGNGATSVTVVSQQLTGLALDTSNGAVGTLSLSPLSFIAGPQSGGLFPTGSNIETFTYSNPDGDMLTESWQILVIQDNTPQPKFFGSGTVTKISGDASFFSNGPLIFWLYPALGMRGATWFLGVSEWTFGTLLFLGFWNRKLGILGALGSSATFIGTVTIIPFMPDGWDASVGGFPAMTGNVPFLMKDVVLLATSLYLLTQDLRRELLSTGTGE